MTRRDDIPVPATLIGLMRELGLLPRLTELIPAEGRLWLCGGALRDALSDRSPVDFDFTCSVAPENTAKALATAISGTCFLLDKERLQYRVLWRHEDRRYSADFAPLRGSDIVADLRDRDFTLNAMAWEVSAPATVLFDPLDGCRALHDAELRMCSKGAFENDPVRVLRGARLAATHRLRCEQRTFEQMRISGAYLKYSPGERLCDELVKLLAVPAVESLEQLRQLGLVGLLFGVDERDWRKRIAAVTAYEERLAELEEKCPVLGDLAEERTADDIRRRTLLKLCIFYQAGAPTDQDWLSGRLRLSSRNGALVERFSSRGVRCPCPLEAVADRRRARALWAAELDADPAAALLYLALGDAHAPPLEVLEKVAGDWHATTSGRKVEALLDGHRVREILPGVAGPQIGRALELLCEAEMRGEVEDRAAAEEYLRRHREKVVDIK